MEIPPDALRRIAALTGFTWTDAELAVIRPAIERALDLLRTLEALPLDDTEPAGQYRIL
jgi:hypothetical protein